MYASIRHYPGAAGLADRLVAHEEEVRALISSVPGYHAYYLVRGDDATTSITICSDRAGTDESNRIAAAWLRENMPDAAVATPQVTAGDVVMHGVGVAATT